MNILVVCNEMPTAQMIVDTCRNSLGKKHNVEAVIVEDMLSMKNMKYEMAIIDLDLTSANGFTIANDIQCIGFDVCLLLCSRKEELVFEAFQFNVFYFIRKSRLEYDLRNAMNKYLGEKNGNEMLILKIHDRIVHLNHRDIICCVVEGNYIRVVTASEVCRIRMTMRDLESRLDSVNFQKSERGTLINLEHITEIEQNRVILDNGEWVHVDKKHYANICAKRLKHDTKKRP